MKDLESSSISKIITILRQIEIMEHIVSGVSQFSTREIRALVAKCGPIKEGTACFDSTAIKWMIVSRIVDGKIDPEECLRSLEEIRDGLHEIITGKRRIEMIRPLPDEKLKPIPWLDFPVRDASEINIYSKSFPVVADKCERVGEHIFNKEVPEHPQPDVAPGSGIYCVRCCRPLEEYPQPQPVLFH